MQQKMRYAKWTPTDLHVTDHAVERFIKRWEPDKNYQQAKAELIALFKESKPAGKTPLGAAIVSPGSRPGLRLVVQDRTVCVTVLPPHEDEASILEREYEEYSDVEPWSRPLPAVSDKDLKAFEFREAEKQDLRNQIAEHNKWIEEIDAEKRALSTKKSLLHNSLGRLQARLKKLGTT